jgi:hypothetical protein
MGQTMDVLVAILTCSLYADDALVRAIVDNAHDNPLAIFTPELDPTTGATSTAPGTLEAAIAQLRDVVAHGGQPLVGLMQVPVTWASTFGRKATDLFDPCINLSIGTAMLSEFEYTCTRRTPLTFGARHGESTGAWARSCVLRQYAEAVRMTELATVVTLSARYGQFRLIRAYDAPIFSPPSDGRSWGADRVLVGPEPPSTGPSRFDRGTRSTAGPDPAARAQ